MPSSTQILLKQGYANHHKKFKRYHGVIVNIRRKQLTRAAPAIRGAICFVDRVDDAIVFNSITEVCISFDDDPLWAELSLAKEGTAVKIGESTAEQGNYLEVYVIRMSCGYLADYNLLQNKVRPTDVVI